MLPGGSRLIFTIQHTFPGLNLYYADPAQPFTMVNEQLDDVIIYLSDLPVVSKFAIWYDIKYMIKYDTRHYQMYFSPSSTVKTNLKCAFPPDSPSLRANVSTRKPCWCCSRKNKGKDWVLQCQNKRTFDALGAFNICYVSHSDERRRGNHQHELPKVIFWLWGLRR